VYCNISTNVLAIDQMSSYSSDKYWWAATLHVWSCTGSTSWRENCIFRFYQATIS